VPVTKVKSRWTSGVLEFVDASGNVIISIDGPNRKVLIPSGSVLEASGLGLDTTELGLLDGATAGSITASKVVSRTAAQGIPHAAAVVAAIGANQGNGAPLTKDINLVTSADNTTCVVLPVGVAGEVIRVVNTVSNKVLPVFPAGTEQINAGGAGSVFTMGPARSADFICTAAGTWYVDLAAAGTANVTQQNYSTVTTAGAAQASKAAVLGANKDLDEVHTAALYIGVAAGTLVTATAANLNAVPTATGTGLEIDANTKDINSSAMTLVIAGGGTPVNTVTMTCKDADGNAVAAIQRLRVYVSDDSAGLTMASAAANGAVSFTTGSLMKEITAKLLWDVITDVNGVAVLSVDGTGGGGYAKYVNVVLPNGKIKSSAVLNATN
jgi:hypothetical protein